MVKCSVSDVNENLQKLILSIMEASLKKYLGLRLKKVFSKRLKLIIIMIIIIILIIIGYTIPSNQ